MVMAVELVGFILLVFALTTIIQRILLCQLWSEHSRDTRLAAFLVVSILGMAVMILLGAYLFFGPTHYP